MSEVDTLIFPLPLKIIFNQHCLLCFLILPLPRLRPSLFSHLYFGMSAERPREARDFAFPGTEAREIGPMSSVASLRQIRRRIRSVENTKKITRAMEMVAAAKLRRFQDFLESARPYTERLESLLDRLPGSLPADYHHPFLEKPVSSDEAQATKRVALVLFTSDTGLCGTYNSDLENLARQWVRQNPSQQVRFAFVGKHGANSLPKEKARAVANLFDLRVSRVDEILEELRKGLATAFIHSEFDEVHVIYTRMESLARHQIQSEKLLPFSKKETSKETETTYLIEPDPKGVLNRLIPMVFEARLRFIFYHALLTEQIARMSAMRQATQNAKEMIDGLTLQRNKARQASITKEIIEIVSGSRALKLK